MTMVSYENKEEFLDAARVGDLNRIKSLTTLTTLLANHDIIRDADDDTALMLASLYGHLEVVQFLVKEDSVNVNKRDHFGYTASHRAGQNDYVEIMKSLIANGANVNQQANDGWTPLHWASYMGYDTVVKFLLKQRGVNPHVRNDGNETALDLARQGGNDHVANIIQQHIQQQELILQELFQCQYKLPSGVWPIAFSRIKSIHFTFQLVCELPHLFQQTAATERNNETLAE